jgi:branched-chain amino acid transport system permease protein
LHPPLAGSDPLIIGGAALLPQSVVVLAGVGLIVVALRVLLTSRLNGKAMLATATNRLAAQLVGIDTSAVVGLAFATSATIGAYGGILIAAP